MYPPTQLQLQSSGGGVGRAPSIGNQSTSIFSASPNPILSWYLLAKSRKSNCCFNDLDFSIRFPSTSSDAQTLAQALARNIVAVLLVSALLGRSFVLISQLFTTGISTRSYPSEGVPPSIDLSQVSLVFLVRHLPFRIFVCNDFPIEQFRRCIVI
jgi:hypothetical protein